MIAHRFNILITSFIFLISFSLCGQTRFGVKTGYNYSKWVTNITHTGHLESPSDYRNGYHIGAFLNIELGNSFFLIPELIFSEKGFKNINPTLRVNDQKLNYINLPILVGYRAYNNLRIAPGMEIGYLISDHIIRKFDIGVVGDVAYSFGEDFNIGFRYVHGVHKILQSNLTDINGNPIGEISFQNRLFQMYAGYQF